MRGEHIYVGRRDVVGHSDPDGERPVHIGIALCACGSRWDLRNGMCVFAGTEMSTDSDFNEAMPCGSCGKVTTGGSTLETFGASTAFMCTDCWADFWDGA